MKNIENPTPFLRHHPRSSRPRFAPLLRGLPILLLPLLSALLSACIPTQETTPGVHSALTLAGYTRKSDIEPDSLVEVARRNDESRLEEIELGNLRPGTSLSRLYRRGYYTDTWVRIRHGLRLSEPMRPEIERRIARYREHQRYLDNIAGTRAKNYLPYIVRQVEKRDIPSEIALLPYLESGFDPRAKSHKGAVGLWQFMPKTGVAYGLKESYWYDARKDVVDSTRAALDYLERLHREFGDNWLLAVAAYNWGQSKLKRAVANNRRAGRPIDIWSLKLPRETRDFVTNLIALSAIIRNPKRHGVELTPIPDFVEFREVDLSGKGQVDLRQVAKLAGISMSELEKLNPGFIRNGFTDPKGPHRVQIPIRSVERLEAALGALQSVEDFAPGLSKYRIAPGDTLSEIAHKNNTSVEQLKELNNLDSEDRIRAGRTLLVPGLFPVRGSRTLRYRVKQGDTLWGIAKRHGIPLKSLRQSNELPRGDTLLPGQEIQVPTGLARLSPSG